MPVKLWRVGETDPLIDPVNSDLDGKVTDVSFVVPQDAAAGTYWVVLSGSDPDGNLLFLKASY